MKGPLVSGQKCLSKKFCLPEASTLSSAQVTEKSFRLPVMCFGLPAKIQNQWSGESERLQQCLVLRYVPSIPGEIFGPEVDFTMKIWAYQLK